MQVRSTRLVSHIGGLVNAVLKPVGLRVERIGGGGHAKIDPLERNKKETLDELWSDPAFLERYLNENKKGLYSSVIEISNARGVLTGSERRIADVGCGPGYFTRMLVEHGFGETVVGYDFSEAGVQEARKNCPAARFHTHDIFQPLPETFDVIFCMETLEHLIRPAAALENLLAKSSVVVLTVPEGRKDSFRGHINFWSKESWDAFIEDAANGRKVFTAEINDGKNLLAIIGGS